MALGEHRQTGGGRGPRHAQSQDPPARTLTWALRVGCIHGEEQSSETTNNQRSQAVSLLCALRSLRRVEPGSRSPWSLAGTWDDTPRDGPAYPDLKPSFLGDSAFPHLPSRDDVSRHSPRRDGPRPRSPGTLRPCPTCRLTLAMMRVGVKYRVTPVRVEFWIDNKYFFGMS